MVSVWMLLAGCALTGASAFGCGWWLRSLRHTKDGPADTRPEPAEWQIMEIIYRNKDRTKEWYRHLNYRTYDSWDEAMREAKRLEDRDTLTNKFDREYVVVEAP